MLHIASIKDDTTDTGEFLNSQLFLNTDADDDNFNATDSNTQATNSQLIINQNKELKSQLLNNNNNNNNNMLATTLSNTTSMLPQKTGIDTSTNTTDR